MKNLNICIDIDGTITDAYFWLDMCNKHFNTSITEDEVTEYYIHKSFGIDEKEYDMFYEDHKFIMHSTQKLRKDVQSIIKNLSLNNNIYFVTARDKSLTMLTHSYLRENEIPYDELFVLGSHYKVDTAKKLDCSVFIEDNYDNAMQLSNAGFDVLLMDTNYNRKPVNDNITRVYNWSQIYEIINKLPLQEEAM
ncbi:MAG: hypothetical protein ABRQ27_03960 [Clostridiaceae bacterium]